MIAHRESAQFAEQLIAESVSRYEITLGTLTLHADRGTSMRSKAVAELLSDLTIIRSHSRPHVSDDNPFSEAQFKTLKYRPDFPERFGCIEDARAHCQGFFTWYDTVHRHSGIGYMTPQSVHSGFAPGLRIARQASLDIAFAANPHRFKSRRPQPRNCLRRLGSIRHQSRSRRRRYYPASHSKFMIPGVAKSLTRSEALIGACGRSRCVHCTLGAVKEEPPSPRISCY
ncbi:integrase core domain-containing protein [Robbsia andropogonis]|uniref:integrase core domain-containing protein n=1 Tax=Robbsia andropogonis TaxID=28092 RepID=UPI002A69E33F|nr:integrase core domain-containing protein [Robbsia andropogonis]